MSNMDTQTKPLNQTFPLRLMKIKITQKLYYQVRSPRKARRPSAMVLVSVSVTILPAAFDKAASLAPLGSAAKIRMAGLMAFAATEIPDIKPPPTFS